MEKNFQKNSACGEIHRLNKRHLTNDDEVKSSNEEHLYKHAKHSMAYNHQLELRIKITINYILN